MGAVIEKGQQPQLVMELMERGSLYDLIHNETVDLDAPMIASILKVGPTYSLPPVILLQFFHRQFSFHLQFHEAVLQTSAWLQ